MTPNDEWWRLYVRRDRKDIYPISPITWGIFVTTRNKAKDEELDVKRRKWKHLGGSNLPQRKPICPLQVPLYAFTVSATLSKFGDKSLSYFQTFRESGKLRVRVWARKEERRKRSLQNVVLNFYHPFNHIFLSQIHFFWFFLGMTEMCVVMSQRC